jgi:hypothetical protein
VREGVGYATARRWYAGGVAARARAAGRRPGPGRRRRARCVQSDRVGRVARAPGGRPHPAGDGRPFLSLPTCLKTTSRRTGPRSTPEKTSNSSRPSMPPAAGSSSSARCGPKSAWPSPPWMRTSGAGERPRRRPTGSHPVNYRVKSIRSADLPRPTRAMATICDGNRPWATTPGVCDNHTASAAGSPTGPW